MAMFLNQEGRSKRMSMIEKIKLEEDYNKARGENPYSASVLQRYIEVVQSTPHGKVVYVDDNTIIPLEDIKKGMFSCYDDMRECFNRNHHVIGSYEDEWAKVYLQSCIDAFESDADMIDYMEMLPAMERAIEHNKECGIYPFANTFYLLHDGSLAYSVCGGKEKGWVDDLHIIKNKMHLLPTPYGNAIRDKDYERAGIELGKAVFGLADSVQIIPCVIFDYYEDNSNM